MSSAIRRAARPACDGVQPPTPDLDDFAGRRRDRSAVASVAVHAVVLALLATQRQLTAPPEVLSEVTWLDAPQPGAAAAGPAAMLGSPPPAPAAAPQIAAKPAPAPSPTAFERKEEAGEVAPDPQSDLDLDARLSDRLASLRAAKSDGPVRPITVQTPTSLYRPNAAGGGNDAAQALGRGHGEGPALVRGERAGTGAGGAFALARGPSSSHGLQLAAAAPVPSPLGGAPAREDAASTSRTLAGALLVGQVADRPVLEYAKPDYPDWAKSEAVEAAVTLRFVVLPDGTVKENVRIERTAGYEDFDQNAQTALRRWRFAPLTGAAAGEQWGTITFRFRLRDA